jgi:hypothetical protein
MKDLIEIDKGIDFCHEMQTVLSRHCVGNSIWASPTFFTNCETKAKVMTPLLPISDTGEYPQIHHVGMYSSPQENVERDQEDVEMVL